MAMNFFQHQEQARSRSGFLLVMFAGCLAIVAGLSALIIDYAWNVYVLWDVKVEPGQHLSYIDHNVGYAFAAMAVMILIASWMKQFELMGGGKAVATALGARSIYPDTKDADERKLLNIVEEISIASTTPPPQVYVLDREQSINACVAGHDSADVALIVTRGSLELLNRDELQGVIGHEYSHIFNGDMKMNMQLTAMAFGVTCVYQIGRFIMNCMWRADYYGGSSSYSYSSSSSSSSSGGGGSDSDDSGRAVLIFIIAGLLLMLVGALGAFFGALLQSAISCQRELLADASAVQYTRNPEGLEGALKKIAVHSEHGVLRTPTASQYSHFFFADATKLFSLATHPPILERIKAIDPKFKGKIDYDSLPWPKPKAADPAQLAEQRAFLMATDPTALALATAVLADGGAKQIGPKSVRDQSAQAGAHLPKLLQQAARETIGASALLYGLLLSESDDIRNKQLTLLAGKANQFVYNQLKSLLPMMGELASDDKLPLACLAVPALRGLSLAQYQQFKGVMSELVNADNEIDLFEFMLEKMVQRHLDGYFIERNGRKLTTLIDRIAPQCIEVLSAVAFVSTPEEQVNAALSQALKKLDIQPPKTFEQNIPFSRLNAAMDIINESEFSIRANFVKAATGIVMHDGVATTQERQMLMAIADALETTVPDVVWSNGRPTEPSEVA
jgi:Zn-dependent protease with chaperone function